MTLACEQCGGTWSLRIVSGSGTADTGVFERYECEHCGNTGTLTYDGVTNETRLSGLVSK
ncbi:hypothetical protein ACFPYI_01800 [Halomarina salina]|uniref:Transcriptional regulator n=1 Tax=Halomarina salina TaxID=1872699 RepID=A0ABD5RIP6_9EURY|nr:hypothetical protein [Halomarina salina]